VFEVGWLSVTETLSAISLLFVTVPLNATLKAHVPVVVKPTVHDLVTPRPTDSAWLHETGFGVTLSGMCAPPGKFSCAVRFSLKLRLFVSNVSVTVFVVVTGSVSECVPSLTVTVVPAGNGAPVDETCADTVAVNGLVAVQLVAPDELTAREQLAATLPAHVLMFTGVGAMKSLSADVMPLSDGDDFALAYADANEMQVPVETSPAATRLIDASPKVPARRLGVPDCVRSDTVATLTAVLGG
jgi:hypothetical protein